MAEESRLKGFIHTPMNSTFITMIPKVENPTSMDYFRSISLCNYLYRIISKVIARRIKEILSRRISKDSV